MKKRKYAAVLLCLLCALLAACAWQGDAQEPQSAPCTIRFALPYDNLYSEKILRALMEDYRAQAGDTQVELLFLPYQDYEQQLMALAVKGEQPDLMLIDNPYFPKMVDQGTIADLDVWLNQTGLMQLLDEEMIQGTQVGENHYGCPFLCWTYALYYNTQEIDEEKCAALQTYGQFIDYAQRYSATGKKLLGIAAADTEELTYQFMELLMAEDMNLHTLRVADDCETLNALEQMLDGGCLTPDCLDWHQTDETRRFAQGALVTMLNRSTQAPYLSQLEPEFAWDVMPLPTNQSGRHVMGVQSIAVSQTAAPQAYDLLQWLMEPAQTERVAAQLNSVAVRPDAYEKLLQTQAETAWPRMDWREDMQYSDNFLSWPAISSTLRDKIRGMLMGELSARDSLQEIQYTVNQYFAW